MKSILVLGGAGMLGHKIFQTIRKQFDDTFCTIRGIKSDHIHKNVHLFQCGNVIENVNAMPNEGLPDLLRDLQPSIIINCIGIVKQKPEAKDSYPSIAINALLPHMLANICLEWGARVIHFSTDCVFSGNRGDYTENDDSDAKDLYGKTKSLGELTTANGLTLRTSIIGRELTGFKSLLEWFISQNNSIAKGYCRAIYSGVTTNYLAELVVDLIKNHRNLCGLYQVTSERISKYELLCVLRDVYDLDIEIVADNKFLCDRSMIGDKFRNATGHKCPTWLQLATQLANDSTPYDKWR